MIQVGDKVVCIHQCGGTDGFAPIARVGRMYIVNEIKDFCCNDVGIDIGMEWIKDSGTMVCANCRNEYKSTQAPFYHIGNFRKIEPEYKAVKVDSEISEQARELISLTETIAQK